MSYGCAPEAGSGEHCSARCGGAVDHALSSWYLHLHHLHHPPHSLPSYRTASFTLIKPYHTASPRLHHHCVLTDISSRRWDHVRARTPVGPHLRLLHLHLHPLLHPLLHPRLHLPPQPIESSPTPSSINSTSRYPVNHPSTHPRTHCVGHRAPPTSTRHYHPLPHHSHTTPTLPPITTHLPSPITLHATLRCFSFRHQTSASDIRGIRERQRYQRKASGIRPTPRRIGGPSPPLLSRLLPYAMLPIPSLYSYPLCLNAPFENASPHTLYAPTSLSV
ncbi:hypothetical protein AB1N83_013256 [Pleurotus pulmonarius]